MPQEIKIIFRECLSQSCGFRFPDLVLNTVNHPSCPKCGNQTNLVHERALSKQRYPPRRKYPNAKNIVCVFDNIRSVYNVGSMFRTMQGFGIKEAFLCGISPCPKHKGFSKTSIGAEKDILWHSMGNAFRTCQSLKEQGYALVTLETSASAIPIMEYQPEYSNRKIALIVGNEIAGVDPSIVDLSDRVLFIPISGKNNSLNVTVAFGIGLYTCLSVKEHP